jgi:hypothetical protein
MDVMRCQDDRDIWLSRGETTADLRHRFLRCAALVSILWRVRLRYRHMPMGHDGRKD